MAIDQSSDHLKEYPIENHSHIKKIQTSRWRFHVSEFIITGRILEFTFFFLIKTFVVFCLFEDDGDVNKILVLVFLCSFFCSLLVEWV